MKNLEKNEMVLNFDELNKLDQFEQADIVWSIIEKLGFKDATMEPNDSGYSIELECEELDEEPKLETDFDQLKREFVWSSGDVNNSYYSYFDVTGYDEDEVDADEVLSYLAGLDTNPIISEIALKYGNLWDTTQQEKWIDLGEYEITQELKKLYK